MDWLQLVLGFLTGGGVIGIAGLFSIRATIRKATVDADKAADGRYIAQINHQQETIDKLLNQVDSFASRLSAQNAKIDNQIDRDRELSDRLYHSEQTINELNEERAALIRMNERLQRANDFLTLWHCRRPFSECRRREPEQKAKTNYNPPEELIALLAASETELNELEARAANSPNNKNRAD